MPRRWSAAPARTCISRTDGAILDMSSLAECSNLGHQHPSVVAAIRDQAERLCFVTNAWGAAAAGRTGRAAARGVRIRGRPRVLHARRRRRQRERGEDRAPGDAARPRGIVVTRDRSYHGATLPRDGALRRRAHARAGRPRRARRQPRAAAVRLSLPLRQHDAPSDCGERAAAAVAERDRPASASTGRRRRDDGAERGHQRHRARRTRTGPRCAGDTRSAASR